MFRRERRARFGLTVLLLGVLLLGGTAPVWAETAYVTDILRLGLHRAQDTSDRPFDNLVSGARLEVLERVPNYARVRTDGGQEGWVKSAYLVDDEPAQLKLAEFESEVAKLRAETARATAARASAEDELARVAKQLAANTDSAGAIQETLARLERDNKDYEGRLERYRGSLPLPWVGAALVVALIAGFVAGLWWLDALIRRRHGGFRVY